MTSQNLSGGTTVLVTGAGGGLGKVIARAFLEAGANVVICDINSDRLETAESELSSPRFAGRFLAREADTTSSVAVDELFQAAVEQFGRVDMLVNNAAVMDSFDPAGTCSRETWDRLLDINLTGPFLTTQAAVKIMEAQAQAQSPPLQGGTIINIGSNASVSGSNAGVAYTVTKHGVLGLTRNTAAFYGDKGIACLMLQLGGLEATNIQQAFAKGMNTEGLAIMQKNFPPFVLGETDVQLADVAKFCVFLADHNIARTMNGAIVPLNKNWPAA
ncbi:hypothetical protein SLS62_010303 [Diatrype stigma]|uniref:Uncharacterized protein n=1 Tax=Diatrype stigma TaxID=117547 RepID=A0AAN9YHK9_9PEZI